MGVDIQQEQNGRDAAAPAKAEPKTATAERPPLLQRVATSVSQVRWRVTLLTALVMAGLWCGLFLANNWLQILAGVVPVMAGLFLGRQVKGNYLAHGIFLGLSGFLFGLIVMLGYAALGSSGIVPLPAIQTEQGQPAAVVGPAELVFFYVSFSIFALIPFPAFGTVMSGRSEERNREARRLVDERGGQLERPGVIRTLEDLQGLSLPQLGRYVADLFRKKGFEFKDYRFIDKDKHLDLELTFKDELYLLRLSVADKVRGGTVESLIQDMKRRSIAKGMVITSTEFTPDTLKSVGQRKNIIAIDGPTLYEIAEK
jgi:Restriction endonuclease